ncbi:MAG: GH92 family glycosyl hydrolase [Gilvibacter sp.]
MNKVFVFLICICFFLSCKQQKNNLNPAVKDTTLTSYVNPFIGTGGHGHTYPGATMPFGMVQLSPDTRLDGWDGCSGYHYSDSYIYGFSHTHLSGTGVSDYGDILLMPTNKVVFNNGANGKPGYRAHFSHDNETATPGYYSVLLDSTNIKVELTVTERAGMHRYQFPEGKEQVIMLDLEHRDKLLDYQMRAISKTEITGFRFSDAWAKDQRVYFYIKFSKPFTIPEFFHRGMDRRSRMGAFTFENPTNDPIEVVVGISAVDIDGAKKNAEQEIGDQTFDQIKANAQLNWEKQLEKVVVESDDHDTKVNFYTSLYHTMIAPNLYQDVDGRYRGMDLEVHQTTDFDYYTVFSLWDTYRAAHPLYTLIEQKRTNDFINTFLAKYDEGGVLPIWDLSANYTGCMIGYHGVPVIADAYLKGIRDYDANKALEAMVYSANEDRLGLESYKEFGFIPMEEESESVSKTLEYAYDDWTIAQMAYNLDAMEVAHQFTERAQNYKNLFNKETGFFQGRFRNTWFSPFDPYEVNFNYTEANAWQYSLYAPQDVTGMANLMGGFDKLEAHLDALFTAQAETSGRDQADITGLIGQYAHGNEPSHHMAYLYNFVGKPAKTQEKVREIVTTLYSNAPDGISGNEDCGQMSAWYVFSSLGFYPVTPGSNQYIIGAPNLKKATINLEDGKAFTITANNLSTDNIYIQNVELNGKALGRSYIFHDEVIAGGNLVFTMGDIPSTWATARDDWPKTQITESQITAAPYIASGNVAFKENTRVTLEVTDPAAQIYMQINKEDFIPYAGPFELTENATLHTYALKNDVKSSVLKTQFYKIDPNRSIALKSEYANQYNAGGNDALIDGIRGSSDFRTGAWQGYQDTDVEAIVDLGRIMPIDSINVSFLQDQRSWIFFPTQVECYVSTTPHTFYKSLPTNYFNSDRDEESSIQTAKFNMSGYSARYIKIVAKNLGDLPEWHLGAPYNGKAWIFVDEIDIK